MDEPYASESFEFEHCPLYPGNGPYSFQTSEIDVTAFYGCPNFFSDRCDEGALCLRFNAGTFMGFIPSGFPSSFGPVLSAGRLSDPEDSEVQTDFRISFGDTTQDENWSIGSRVNAVFSGTTPNEIAIEIEIACFIETPDDPPTGCALPEYSSCLYEHLGTFTIAGTQQEE